MQGNGDERPLAGAIELKHVTAAAKLNRMSQLQLKH